MKIYSLRLEDPLAILGHLAKPTTNAQAIPDAYNKFITVLTEALEQYALEPVTIELHNYADLETCKANNLEKNAQYLNFDSQSKLGISLGVSRHFDFLTSKQLGITSRPAFAELDDQINAIIENHGKTFGIIEDDIYTGGTLRYMLDYLNNRGITVTSIVSGISSTKSMWWNTEHHGFSRG